MDPQTSYMFEGCEGQSPSYEGPMSLWACSMLIFPTVSPPCLPTRVWSAAHTFVFVLGDLPPTKTSTCCSEPPIHRMPRIAARLPPSRDGGPKCSASAGRPAWTPKTPRSVEKTGRDRMAHPHEGEEQWVTPKNLRTVSQSSEANT